MERKNCVHVATYVTANLKEAMFSLVQLHDFLELKNSLFSLVQLHDFLEPKNSLSSLIFMYKKR